MANPDMSWKSKGLRYIQSQRNNLSELQNAAQSSTARQGWREWAGNKLKTYVQGDPANGGINEERIALFPGWCARRYHRKSNSMDGAFSVDVFVSGYASSHRPPEQATRSQRTFMRLAKSFAALPKVAADALDPDANASTSPKLTASTEDLLKTVKLPPPPENMTRDLELEALEEQFRKANTVSEDDSESSSSSGLSRRSSASSSSRNKEDEADDESSSAATLIGQDLRRFHANLERRLQPFWSSVVSSRTVQLYVFASLSAAEAYRTSLQNGSSHELPPPISSQKVTTQVDGSFQTLFRLSWERLCQHPEALHIAFGDLDKQPGKEHEFYVVAELMPPPKPTPDPVNYHTYQPRSQRIHSPSSSVVVDTPTAVAIHATPLTFSPLRVLSDIDDTVKTANVLSGARNVFHTVFVKDFAESIIPGMGEWYTRLWQKGIRFHYVSNGPFELLPVIQEFFQISGLPPGSIKLRSYAGRSLFSGLLTAPAARKRASVLDILNSFPDSRFILVGDSGEQDLELYAEVASERSEQVRAIFIRDVEPEADPLSDPTGELVESGVIDVLPAGPNSASRTSSLSMPSTPAPQTPQRSWSDLITGRRTGPSTPTDTEVPDLYSPAQPDGGYFSSSPITSEPQPLPSMSISTSKPKDTRTLQPPKSAVDPKTPNNWDTVPSSAASIRSVASNMSNKTGQPQLTDAQRRRNELQNRVWRARSSVPPPVILRIFRHPQECKEMEEVLRLENLE